MTEYNSYGRAAQQHRRAGGWTPLGILMAVVLAVGSVSADDSIIGDWAGTLSVGGQTIPLVLHVSLGLEGALVMELDSPHQGAYGLSCDVASYTDSLLTFGINRIGGTFEGTLQGDGTIEGDWSQSGSSWPLTLSRDHDVLSAPLRPQTPEGPYPYQVEQVSFENAEAAVTLAGTLTLPEGTPKVAVVLVSGSGPQDRDETIFAHKPFLVLADHLTRAGIAVLRYDDRGFGESTGDFSQAVTADFGKDASAAVAYLKSRPETAGVRVGIVGHSEGSIAGVMAAADDAELDFLLGLAGPMVRGRELMIAQTEALSKAGGVPLPYIPNIVESNTKLYDASMEEGTQEGCKKRVKEVLAELRGTTDPALHPVLGIGPSRDETTAALMSSGWMRQFLRYDPAQDLARVSVPILAIFGGLDAQVPAAMNEKALLAVKPDAQVKVFPKKNHLFQNAVSGAVVEYQQIEETMSVDVLEFMAAWILEQGASHEQR